MILPLILFAILSCTTPGPNTLTLASSGANFGFRRTLPYSLGIVVGRAGLQILVIAFLGVLFASSPIFQSLLRVLGSGYLLYLSYKIATAQPVQRAIPGRELSFTEAALYQFVNPKVWANTTTAIGVFVSGSAHYLMHASAVVVTFAIVSLIGNSVWTLFGVQIGRLLRSPVSRRRFNYSMAALNAACILLIWV